MTKTGNVPVRTIYADDTGLNLLGISCPNELLAPGEHTTCGVDTGDGTGSKTLTLPVGQAALDAGKLANSATAYAYDPVTKTTVSASDTVDRDLTEEADFGNSLALTKKAGQIVDSNGNGITDADDAIGYAFEVKNTGSQTLNLLEVNDPGLVTKHLTCEYATIRPSETTICISKTGHVLEEAEVIAGTYTNKATAQAKTPQGTVVPSKEATATTPIPNEPKITLEKIAGPVTDVEGTPAGDSRGDTIAYTFRVRNTGGVPVTDVTITDTKLKIDRVTCGGGTIAPGAMLDCVIPATSATYTLTRADVNALKVENTATASATANGKATSATDTATVPLAPRPSITLDKTHDDGDAPRRIGQTITYRFTVKNAGAGTLKTVRIKDPRLGIDGYCDTADTTIPVPNTPDNADDGAYSLACTLTGTYEVTQADVDAGRVANTATATAVAGSGATVSASDDDTVLTQAEPPAITLEKTAGGIADTNGNGKTDDGDTLTYRFTVTNTGGSTLAGATITDLNLDLTGAECVTTALAPGESGSCEKSYGLKDPDLAGDGKIENTATATGLLPAGSTGSAPTATDTATAYLASYPQLKVEKTAALTLDANRNGLADAGDRITYGFTVTNTSNTTSSPVTLDTVTLQDAMLGGLTPECTVPNGRLAPGDSLTCDTAVWRVTPEDVAQGAVKNTATASGTIAGGGSTPESAPSTTTTQTGKVPADLRLEKSAALVEGDGDGLADPGETIHYTFTVTNTGGVGVTGAKIDDPLLAAHGVDVICPATAIAAKGSITCTADMTVTTADVRPGGSIDNTATAAGTSEGIELHSPESTASVRAGQNTTPPPTPEPNPTPGALGLTKTARLTTDKGAQGVADVGDVITYGFVVTNPSGVAVSSVSVSDARLAGASVSCPSGPLAPGASTTCSAAPYTVTAADLAAAAAGDGRITNTATASGGEVTSPPASASVPAAPTPAIALRKTASLSTDRGTAGALDAGDVITYSFVVTNTGPTPLTGVALSDPTAGATTCPKTELARGESMTCAAPAHTVTAADVAAGAVTNTATVAATGPGGVKVDATDTAVLGRPAPRIDLVKTATLTTDTGVRGAADAGDVITYGFTVTNPGNVPLTGVRVLDPTLGAVTCPKTDLAAGESMRCTGPTRTVTKADVDAGVAIANTALATGTPPAAPPTDPTGTPTGGPTGTPTGGPTDPPTGPTTGAPVEAPGTATVPIAPKPVARLDMTKSFAWADGGSRTSAQVGDGILYTFTVVNTGTTTVRDVAVNDPRLGALGISVTCPRGELHPGDDVTCRASAPYRITAADAQRGSVLNTAVAQATSPRGTIGTAPTKPSSPKDTVTIPVSKGSPRRPTTTRPKAPTTKRPGTTRPGTTRPGATRPWTTGPGTTRPVTLWPGGTTPGSPGYPGTTTCVTCRPGQPWGPDDPRVPGRKGKGVAVGEGPPLPPDGPGDPYAPLPTAGALEAPADQRPNAAAAAPAPQGSGARATQATSGLRAGEAAGLVGLGLLLPASVTVFLTGRRRRRNAVIRA